MPNIITRTLPHDLPENWTDTQYVSPGGTEVGLTPQHGYNYLMKMVNDVQISIEELDAYLASIPGNKNLLHNWYFKSPIDTKKGYYIPSGMSYYNSQDFTTKIGTTLNISNPDYVGSSYASFVISGVTYYVPKSSLQEGYIATTNGDVCIDRWHIKSYSAAYKSYMRMLTSSCELVLSRQTGDFYQNVNSAISADKFGGFTYTLSAKVESVSGGTVYLYITDGVKTEQVRVSAAGTYLVSLAVSTGASKFVVGIKNTHTSAESTIKVSAMKLELGVVSTLASDPPADKAEEMAKCIQYDASTDAYTGFTALMTANVLADATITS